MNYNFVSVFSEKDRDKLILAGYKLMKSDYENDVYTFVNDDSLHYCFSDECADGVVMTNTLTF